MPCCVFFIIQRQWCCIHTYGGCIKVIKVQCFKLNITGTSAIFMFLIVIEKMLNRWAKKKNENKWKNGLVKIQFESLTVVIHCRIALYHIKDPVVNRATGGFREINNNCGCVSPVMHRGQISVEVVCIKPGNQLPFSDSQFCLFGVCGSLISSVVNTRSGELNGLFYNMNYIHKSPA